MLPLNQQIELEEDSQLMGYGKKGGLDWSFPMLKSGIICQGSQVYGYFPRLAGVLAMTVENSLLQSVNSRKDERPRIC